MSGVVDRIIELYETRGGAAYAGEPVSQLEHGLQAAEAASRTGAGDALVVAALLHDIGHLTHDLGEDCADRGIDSKHEQLGADFLARHFVAEVSEPVRLHVDAKRYFCGTNPAYLARLSPASVQSLKLQGGPFDAEAAACFDRNPHAEAAKQLRRFDEAAKVPQREVPGVRHYRAAMERCLKQN